MDWTTVHGVPYPHQLTAGIGSSIKKVMQTNYLNVDFFFST